MTKGDVSTAGRIVKWVKDVPITTNYKLVKNT